MSYSLLYLKKRIEPAAFQDALTALVSHGFHIATAPEKNRDGVAARLQKEEAEVWLEWMDDDSLSVSTTCQQSERLKTEVTQILSSANLRETKVI